jgi:hypothetical protein
MLRRSKVMQKFEFKLILAKKREHGGKKGITRQNCDDLLSLKKTTFFSEINVGC